MKRRVRIYQEGGMPGATADMNAEQPMDDNQLIEGIIQELGQGSSLADVNYKLVQSGVPQQKAQMLIGQVAAYLQEQKQNEAEQIENTDDTPEAQEAAAQAQADADTVEQDAYNAQMQQMYADSQEANPDTDAMKYGGIPSKKAFVKSYISNYKKQEGGPSFDPSTDVLDGRQAQLQKFLGAVKTTATDAALKEQAEKAYEQQMQAAMSNPYEEMPEAQFGGGLFQGMHERRAARRLNKMMPMGMPNLALLQYMQSAPGANYGLANIDVRRTGLFGRPKEYTINFWHGNGNANNYTNPAESNTATQETATTTTTPAAKTTVTETSDEPITFSNTKATEPTTTSTTTGTTTTGGGNTGGGKKETTPKETTPVVEDKKKTTTPKPQVKPKVDTRVTFNPHVNAQGKIDGSKDFIDPNKSYTFDYATKKWYRGNTLIKDTKSISNLNRWMKEGILSKTAEFDGYSDMPYGYDPAKDPLTGKYRPMSALADDDLISTVALIGASPAKYKNLGQYIVKQGARQLLNPGQNQLGPGQNMLNPGQNALNPGQGMLNPGQGMLNPGQRMLNPPGGFQYSLPFQMGGFTDEQSGLYRFIGGGEDPSISQLDIDYANSKNTADPYFAEGGLYRYDGTGASETKVDYSINPVTGKAWTADEWSALSKKKEQQASTNPFSPEQEAWFKQHYGNVGQQGYGYPAYGYNPYMAALAPGFFGGNRPVSYAGSWTKMIGNPYMTGTDTPALNLLGPNTRISSIDVKKTGMFSKMPKKYTVNFSNYLDNTAPIFTDKPGMSTAAAQQQAASGPGVSPDADKYDGLNVRQAKRAARNFQTSDEVTSNPVSKNFSFYNAIPATQSSEYYLSEDKNGNIESVPQAKKNIEGIKDLMDKKAKDFELLSNPQPDNFENGYIQPTQFAYGGYLPQAQVGNFPPVQGFYKDTRKNKSNTSYTGKTYALPNQKAIPSETTQKVGQYAKTAGADQQRSSMLREKAAKDIAAKNAQKYGEDYKTAFAKASQQVKSPDFNSGEYLQRQEKADVGSGPASSAVVKEFTPQSSSSRAWEYITNPMTAAEYAISGGGAENMPHNINAMRVAGIDPGATQGRNLVGNAVNSSVNVLDAADKVVGNAAKGNYLTAGAEALRLIPGLKALKVGAQEFGTLARSGALGNAASVAEGALGAGQTAASALHLHDAAGLLKEKILHAGAHEADHTIHEIMSGAAHHAYGGVHYLPHADVGQEVTVYTSRPEYAGISNVQMTQKDIAPESEFKAPQGSTFDFSAFSNQNVPENKEQITDKTALATMDTKIDPNQANRDNLAKSVQKQDWSADFKNKNAWTIDPEAALNTFNAGARGLASFISNSRAAGRQNQYMQNNMNSDALFAVNEHENKGTYDPNSGILRPKNMPFTGVVKYGGAIYQEGGEAYMTQEEIDDFIANGGELEYLND